MSTRPPTRGSGNHDRAPGLERVRGASELVDLVVISGFSGAGKSLAMQVFEDAGYFCVDNLPPEMLRQLAQLFVHEGSKVKRACVVSDTRGGSYFQGLVDVLDQLREDGVAVRLLFLQADQQTLLTRYKETRRRHPSAPSGSVVDGIQAEIDHLAPVRDSADLCIDTTGLSAAALRRKVAAEMLEQETGRLAVSFVSFGHKHGPPRDADLAFDVRFLSNPHYEADLRPLTGFDSRIVEHISRDGRLREFYDHVIPLLEFLLPQYVAEGKSHLVVAIGCTGGRHRSVAIAEHLAEHCRRAGPYAVEVQHRDVDRAPTR
jgi:UPF0042 nucleotide-binding protein